jgi:hypothetical protein
MVVVNMKISSVSQMCRVAALVAISTAVAVPGVSTLAADKPAAKARPKKNEPPPPDTLTRDELRACMARDKKRKTMRDDVLKDQTALDREGAAAKTEADAITAAAAALDRTSEEAVKAHNERIAANDQAIEAYKSRAQKVSEKADALNTEDAAYAKDCAGRPFEERDEIAIKRGK